MKKDKQPAKINYFFGPGWKKLGMFIKTFWTLNKDDVKKKQAKYESGIGIISLKGVANIISCFMLILFGTLFFLLISGCVSIVMGTAFIVVYAILFLVWLVDRLYLLQKRIFVACPNCKEKYMIPTYICPSCSRKHTKLTPGKYGAFKRTCNCGTKLPTNFLTKRNTLSAECPKCGHSLSATESKPICVPIIGGRSAGKTAYITSFAYEFIERVAPRNGLSISYYNNETEDFYNREIKTDYLSGTTRMTKTENDILQASSKAFSFLISNKKLKPDRLIQIYDVAGESFVDNTENEVQLQYGYCHGIVFMLDPLAIPSVRNYFDDRISEIDKNSVGTLDIDLILDSFMNKLRIITGQSSEKIINTPLAVVVSKGDVKILDKFIGTNVINEYLDENNLDIDSYMDVEDYIVKKFLEENGMASFVSNVNLKFRNNRFFVCSSIGHTREAGKYNPKGVLEPMEWIFHNADSAMKSVWNEHKFGTKIK